MAVRLSIKALQRSTTWAEIFSTRLSLCRSLSGMQETPNEERRLQKKVADKKNIPPSASTPNIGSWENKRTHPQRVPDREVAIEPLERQSRGQNRVEAVVIKTGVVADKGVPRAVDVQVETRRISRASRFWEGVAFLL